MSRNTTGTILDLLARESRADGFLWRTVRLSSKQKAFRAISGLTFPRVRSDSARPNSLQIPSYCFNSAQLEMPKSYILLHSR